MCIRDRREVAQKRLKAIEQYSMLGAGFKIAMRDLEIRGAGNLLGAEQSGHIAAVGYEMYCRLLDEAVRDLKAERPPATASRTAIDIGISGMIPKQHIPSDQRRMEVYRRIATAVSPAELTQVTADLTAAYGEAPKPLQRLLELAELRISAAAVGVRTISIRGPDVLIRTENAPATAEVLRHAGDDRPVKNHKVQGASSPATATVRVLPPPSGESLHEVYFRLPPAYFEPVTLLAVLRKRLGGGVSRNAQSSN